MKVRDYKDLQVWQKGIDVVDAAYSVTDQFPREELYGLVSQMRRAAVSIPANIAEGFMRQHTGEYRQFLYVALGSCAELETLGVIAARRTYSIAMVRAQLEEMLNHETRMLASLIRALSRVTGRGSRTTERGSDG